jgi:hypothetical protein
MNQSPRNTLINIMNIHFGTSFESSNIAIEKLIKKSQIIKNNTKW